MVDGNKSLWDEVALYPVEEIRQLYRVKLEYLKLLKEYEILQQENNILKQKNLSLQQQQDALTDY